MWPLLVNWPHKRQRRVGLCERRRVFCTPHMNSCLCVNWTWASDVWFLWTKVKSAPSAVARARRAPSLVVSERGVCVVGALCVRVSFEVGVSVGYGLS
jgi:hypothetical protein